jgi:AcrR family transcriptional regulator
MTRKQEIIETAKTLFRERGYKSVSMRDLAKVMDLKAASLYNHISSKEEILSEIVLGVAESFTDKMGVIKSLKEGSKKQLEEVINHHIDLTLKNPEALAILNNDWMHLEGSHLTDYKAMRAAYENDLRSIISQGIERQEIKSQNMDIILFSMLSTLRTLHLWYRKRSDFDEKALKKEISEILLNGIIFNH